MNIIFTELYPLNRGKPARARKRDPDTAAKRTKLMRSAI